MNLVAYPRLQLVVTVDERGLIKVWKAENGWESASFCLPTHSSALEACDHTEGPVLLVSDLAVRSLGGVQPSPSQGNKSWSVGPHKVRALGGLSSVTT